ncbi:MAG: 4a-hydroxytetrahydrobiopterin dehydratase [Chloroflexi bacterium]|nr:4a-hydroxytetrahydrobiopterin dehydratase [Chloroflexota bacterium]
MINLAAGQCVACRGGEPTLANDEVEDLLFHVIGWQVVDADKVKRIEKAFKFKNFAEAMEFTNKLAAIAEEQGHHPRIITEWGGVTVQWWTHVIQGLHRNDFIMAAKTDELFG